MKCRKHIREAQGQTPAVHHSLVHVNIKEGRYKPRARVSVDLLAGARLRRRRRRRRAHAPTSNAAGHDNREKINSWVSFSFLYGYGAPLARLRRAGAPILHV